MLDKALFDLTISGPVICVACSDDGNKIVVGDRNGNLTLLNKNGQIIYYDIYFDYNQYVNNPMILFNSPTQDEEVIGNVEIKYLPARPGDFAGKEISSES